jgi:hypothetical protein
MSVFERRVEKTVEEAMRVGREARDILNTQALYDAVEEAEINFLEEMAFHESANGREQARMKVLALTEVVKELRTIQSDGEHAEKVIEERNQ